MLISEEIEVAVDLVDRVDEFGPDRLGIVERQGRSQQFHAGQAVFRPVQRVEPVLRDHMEAGSSRGSGRG